MAKKSLYKVGIVGATGLVGGELIQLLEREGFPVESLRLFAGFDDAGEKLEWEGEEILVEPIRADYFQGLDLVFFSAHPMVSRDLAEEAEKAGVVVIDASREWRLVPEIALVVPEVNPDSLERFFPKRKIIASPSPGSVALSLVLAPLLREFGIERAWAIALYGSTQGGRAGFEEHQQQTIAIFNQQDFEIKKFPRQSAFNVFPQVGRLLGEESEEERDIKQELKKILAEPDLKISLTCAQIPVFCGLSIALAVEVKRSASAQELRELLSQSAGIKVMDNPEEEIYPDTLACLEEDRVLVGRIRQEPEEKNLFQLWLSSDNLRKGSSLNMIQIAQLLIAKGLI